MKNLKIITIIIFSSCLLFACSSNSSSNAGKSGDSTTSVNSSQSSGDSTYSGNSSLTYTIGGRAVAIKNNMQDGDGKNWMALYVNEVSNKTGGKIRVNLTNELSKEVFDFTIANTGTTAISHYSPSLANFAGGANEASYMSPKYKNYYGDAVTITITGLDATHVTGTFSGKFLSGDDKPLSLEITNGSFDVPFTKDKSN